MRRIVLQPDEVFSNKHLQRKSAFNAKALEIATGIVEDVRERGDEALRELTEKFDGVKVENFRVPQEAIDEAVAQCDPMLGAALEQAAAQIRAFHERQLEQSWFAMRSDGALVGAGIYNHKTRNDCRRFEDRMDQELQHDLLCAEAHAARQAAGPSPSGKLSGMRKDRKRPQAPAHSRRGLFSVPGMALFLLAKVRSWVIWHLCS